MNKSLSGALQAYDIIGLSPVSPLSKFQAVKAEVIKLPTGHQTTWLSNFLGTNLRLLGLYIA